MGLLSLCMIVRDEADWLLGCLASVRGVVDQMVVLDTGSSDATVALAQAAGAEVHHFVWRDDFSAARNAALAHVRCRYVLVLDADERLAPGAGKTLRDVVRRVRPDLGLLPLHNADQLDVPLAAVISGQHRKGAPVLLPRLFRRTPDLRWEGVVHESVGAWMAARKRQVCQVDAPIVHFGDVAELRAQRGKAERNRSLLEKRWAADPGDAIGAAFLAREYLRVDQAAAAHRVLAQTWAALHPAGPGGQCIVQLVTLLAHQFLGQERPAAAAAVLRQAAGWGVRHPNLAFLRGVVHLRLAQSRTAMAQGHLQTAVLALERALSCAGQTYASEPLPGCTGWAAHGQLGRVMLILGRPGAALVHFVTALHGRPRDAHARLGKAEALIDGGAPGEALRWLGDDVGVFGADGWILAADAALQLGQGELAATLCRRAMGAARQRRPTEWGMARLEAVVGAMRVRRAG